MPFTIQDIALLNWLNHNFVPHSIPVLKIISYSTTYLSIALVVIVLIASIIRKSQLMRKQFFQLALILGLVAFVTQGLKATIYRERPFITYSYIEKLSDGGGSSFPSGHTMEVFAIATTLSLMFRKKKIVIPLFLWAGMVSYSRMALGVHYPSDVLAGIIIGVLIGWSVPWFFNRFNFRRYF